MCSNHSFSNVSFVSTECNLVRVGACVTIKELLDLLSKNDKTMLNLGIVREQTVVGVILTETHVSGQHACLSDQSVVEEIKIQWDECMVYMLLVK